MASILAVYYSYDEINSYLNVQMLHNNNIVIRNIMPMNEMAAVQEVQTQYYDLILINADYKNYIQTIKAIRIHTNCYIIVISSNNTYEEKLEAYIAGADLFCHRFKRYEERAVQTMAIIRRFVFNSYSSTKESYSHKDIIIDRIKRKIFQQGKEIMFCKKEFEILLYLISNRGHVLTYEQIFRHVWGEEYANSSNNLLWNQIKRIRRKLHPCYIVNVRDIGYKIDDEPEEGYNHLTARTKIQ